MSRYNAITAELEANRIDVLVKAKGSNGTDAVAIELKIGSSEGKNQLAAYDRHLTGYRRIAKLFLTASGEYPRSGTGWLRLKFAELVAAIDSELPIMTALAQNMEDCVETWRNFGLATEFTCMNSVAAAWIFGLQDRIPDSTFAVWAEATQAKGWLRRAWLQSLGEAAVRRLPREEQGGWVVQVDPPQKNHENGGILDLVRYVQVPAVRVGIQYEGKTVKVSAVPADLPDVADPAQITAVYSVLNGLRDKMRLHEKRTNTKTKGFASVLARRLPTVTFDAGPLAQLLSGSLHSLHVAMRELDLK